MKQGKARGFSRIDVRHLCPRQPFLSLSLPHSSALSVLSLAARPCCVLSAAMDKVSSSSYRGGTEDGVPNMVHPVHTARFHERATTPQLELSCACRSHHRHFVISLSQFGLGDRTGPTLCCARCAVFCGVVCCVASTSGTWTCGSSWQKSECGSHKTHTHTQPVLLLQAVQAASGTLVLGY